MVENKLQNPPIASQTVEEKPSSGQSLGKLMSEARSRRGASREQVAQETRSPPSYIRMIESDNY
ncbi:MAG TPA: helix-turn-helix domain-containing protein, partial [Candidatus Binataceae bacterium]